MRMRRGSSSSLRAFVLLYVRRKVNESLFIELGSLVRILQIVASNGFLFRSAKEDGFSRIPVSNSVKIILAKVLRPARVISQSI